jgi:hypothetical protein
MNGYHQLMLLGEFIWKPHWGLLLAGVAVIVLIWQGARNRSKIAQLEKKIDRLEVQSGKHRDGV